MTEEVKEYTGGCFCGSIRYSMVIQWSDEDQLFLVHLPEFPWQQFHTHGKTYEEAAKNGADVIEAFALDAD